MANRFDSIQSIQFVGNTARSGRKRLQDLVGRSSLVVLTVWRCAQCNGILCLQSGLKTSKFRYISLHHPNTSQYKALLTPEFSCSAHSAFLAFLVFSTFPMFPMFTTFNSVPKFATFTMFPMYTTFATLAFTTFTTFATFPTFPTFHMLNPVGSRLRSRDF